VCRCDERLNAEIEGSTRLVYTGLRGGLEQLKIKTSKKPLRGTRPYVVYYKSRKRELKAKLMNESVLTVLIVVVYYKSKASLKHVLLFSFFSVVTALFLSSS
jgi:hypothetical protein